MPATDYEYNILMKWENKSTGLMIRPKAFLENGLLKILVMHKYDRTLRTCIPHMNHLQKLEAAFQISQGVTCLHKLNVAHNDLGLNNILYDHRKNRYDIIDFESSIILNPNEGNAYKQSDVDDLRSVIRGILLEQPKMLSTKLEDVSKIGYTKEITELIQDFESDRHTSAQHIAEIFEKALLTFKNDN